MAQVIFIVFSTLLMMAILGLFLRKVGLQLQYLRLEQKKDPGEVTDFLRFSWQDLQARQIRWQAFLLFPMLYGVPMDEESNEKMNLKRAIKRTHILIYLALIILVVLGVFSEKVFPTT